MALATRRRLGRYEVLAPLGSGGMGEVYRARDERLGREVAIKILSEAAAAKPGRLRRFEQEARAVAALNHPNILTVHDVGLDDGTPYIVTELLEGQTLRTALAEGGFSTQKAVEVGIQVALGLSAAHAKGILHRDLKPENVFLTNDGRAKILDFGLAKLRDESGALGSAVTTDAVVTSPGALLGTVGYTAPEQLRGGSLDGRADLFALGVVLHEMLSGRAPFKRASAAETLTAILNEDPPRLTETGRAISGPLDALVRRCLEKRPEDRFESAHDLALTLRTLCGAAEGREADRAQEEDTCPYPGLRPFLESDAPHFFGREGEVTALWEKLRSRPLLAVIGASGVGKTSFVRAGVIAARPPGWAALACTPGTAPLASLARALAPELAGDPEALRDLVAGDDAKVLVRLVARWRNAHRAGLVVVDQFEELFSLNDPDAQAEFAQLLGRLATEADVHVLLSLRDDFLMRCHDHPELAPVFADLTPLGQPGAEGLRRALVEPAHKGGYAFEDEALVEEMLDAVRGERGALPLLAFAVSRIWEKRDRERRLLTRAAQAEIGGVSGALAQHAEATLDRIGRDRQGVVREILRNLVTAQGIRASIDREELLSAFPDRASTEQALRELIDARLLTSYAIESPSGDPGHHRIEIVHESLLRAWPRLVRWQAQDEEGALLRDQLRQAAHLWEEKGRPDDLLWSGASYREFVVWRERYSGRLMVPEERFAAAMVGRASRRRRLRRAAVATVIAVLLAVAAAIGLSRQEAVEQARRAEASRLVALGRLELDRYPTAAVAYARASLEIADNLEARVLAVEALWHGPPARMLPESSGVVAPLRAAFSPDGRRLALSGFGDTVVVYSDDGRALHRLAGHPVVADPRGVAFDSEGDRLLTFAVRDANVRFYDRAGRLAATIPAEAQWVRVDGAGRLITYGPSAGRPQEKVLSVVEPGSAAPREITRWTPHWPIGTDHAGTRLPTSVDPSLNWLAYGRDRGVYLHPLSGSSDRRDAELGRHQATVRDVQFHPDGERLFSVDDAGEIRVWSRSERRLLSTLGGLPVHRYSFLSLDAQGKRLAWFSGSQRLACVWETDGPPTAAMRRLIRSDVTDGGAVVFQPEGDWLASTSFNATALWPLGLPESRVVLVHRDGPVADLAFSPDSRVLASAARDGLYLVPLTPDAGSSRRIDLGAEYFGYGVAWTPSGREVALTAPVLGVYLVPYSGGAPRKLLDYPSQKIALGHAAFDAAGQRLAVVTMYSPDARGKLVYVIDSRSGAVRQLPVPPVGPGIGLQGQMRGVGFTADGDVVTAGDGGIRRWNLASGSDRTIAGGPGTFAMVAISADGRRAAATIGKDFNDNVTIRDSHVRVLDLDTGAQRVIRSHGNRLTRAIATDPRGEMIVTGDSVGVVRVGSTNGEEPHLLLGHSGAVTSVAVSPDRRWIASASGAEVRLWPVPDLSKPPFHTLPLEALLAKLRALTNLEVVGDPASPTGYKVAIGPFPGWSDTPTW